MTLTLIVCPFLDFLVFFALNPLTCSWSITSGRSPNGWPQTTQVQEQARQSLTQSSSSRPYLRRVARLGVFGRGWSSLTASSRT